MDIVAKVNLVKWDEGTVRVTCVVSERMKANNLPDSIELPLGKDPIVEGWIATEIDGGVTGYIMPE